MAISATNLHAQLQTHLPRATIEVIDLAGDGDHYRVVVTSPDFAGRPRVAQHQMVYAALGDTMKATLHALSIETKTPLKEQP